MYKYIMIHIQWRSQQKLSEMIIHFTYKLVMSYNLLNNNNTTTYLFNEKKAMQTL